MRAYPIIAIAAVILVGAGVKLTQLKSVQAQYGDRARLHAGSASTGPTPHVANLPVEQFHDMSFVFSDGDGDVTTGGIAAAAAEEPRKGNFTPRCAERDLRAIAAIEEFGQFEEIPTAWLAQAGLDWLQARSHCLAGAENEGVRLYDRIIAGSTRAPNEQASNARGRR
jgi:hypothetical protein